MNHLNITRFPEAEYRWVEAMNTLCTNLSYSGKDMKTILITSRYEDEGKSLISMNLLRTLAGLRKKVVMVDADLRRSCINRSFRIQYESTRTNGLAQYLAGLCPMDDILYETDIPNAYMIPVGRTVANPLNLLNAPEMPTLMEKLREEFDYIIIDTPPAGIVIDAVDMARHCDGALIVVSYMRGKCRDITEVRDMIRQTGCKVLGTVMNNVEFDSLSNKHYYYSSGRYAYNYDYRKRYESGETPPKKKKKKHLFLK